MPFKSEKQRRYLWANEPEIARDWTDRYGAENGGIMDMASDGNLIHDFENYKKGNSVNVPTSFQARSHSTPVNLAYITDDEAGILQSLKPGTPHRGPMEIPNYDDYSPTGGYRSGAAMSAAETGAKTERARADLRQAGVSPQEAQDIRSGAIASGAGQTVNPGWFGPRHRPGISKQDLRAAKQFAPKAYRATRGSPFGIGNLFRGAMSMFGGIPGKAMSMLSHINPQKLRGWNEEEGRYNTQDEWESARRNRQFQGRLDKMYRNKSLGKGFSQKNIDMLEAMGLKPSTAQNVDSGRGSKLRGKELTNKLSANNYNFGSTPFHPSQGGIMSTPQGTSFNNPVGGLDQYAREMEALEKARAGDIVTASELGGTLQDFYTNKQPYSGKFEVVDDNINFTNNSMPDFPLKGTFDKDAWEYNQPEEWQTQEFPVRQDFLPQEKMTSSITQTGKPMINDEWRWNRW